MEENTKNDSDVPSEHENSEILSENDGYVPQWIQRKRENFEICTHDTNITNEDLQWPNSSSEEEMEKEIMIQNRLRAKNNSKNVLENWNRKKEIWKKLRPKKNPKKFFVPRETIKIVDTTNSYLETIEVERERMLTNEEIFKKIPDFFLENPFFVDLSEKFQNDWFIIRKEEELLDEKSGTPRSESSQISEETANVIEEKNKKDEESSSESDLSESISSCNKESVEKEVEIEVEKKVKVEKDSVGSNKNQPMDMDMELEVVPILDARTRRNILKNAAIFHEEFGLKATKSYFYSWKRKVDQINERKFIKAQRKEDKRGKKITEKSLIKREEKVDIAKKKQKSKELYYKGEATEFKLVHALPKKLNKFIKNCNDIYKIV